MELALAMVIGTLTACGVWLLLRARTFDVILGLTFLAYAVNLLIFSMGRLRVGAPPILREGVMPTLANHVDPLPQALVLTAIVIGFAMTAVLLVVSLRSRSDNGSDHVDATRARGEEDGQRDDNRGDGEGGDLFDAMRGRNAEGGHHDGAQRGRNGSGRDRDGDGDVGEDDA